MIFISAQPDAVYFIWQLELLLRSYKEIGVEKMNVHILVGYDRSLGVSEEFNNFIVDHLHYANFFCYEDTRSSRNYLSSIRPHLLKKHFDVHPELKENQLFYHDSDVLFTRIPRLSLDPDYCYVADTRSYTGVGYLSFFSDGELLNRMTSIVGISTECVVANDENSGGAQYVLSGIDSSFWAKVELDSEKLFVEMKDYNQSVWEDSYVKSKKRRGEFNGVQAWCADMWAVLWNLWLVDKKVLVEKELSFSWPDSPIADWSSYSIQHYSGNNDDKSQYFHKGRYLNYPPWYDDRLDSIPNTSCSYKIVQKIKARRLELDSHRPCFPHAEVILFANSNLKDVNSCFKVIKQFINKYIDVTISLHSKNYSDQFSFNRKGLSVVQYKVLVFINLERIPTLEMIKAVLNESMELGFTSKFWLSKMVFKVDSLFLETFCRVLDDRLLLLNKNKFNYEYDDEILAIGVLKNEFGYSSLENAMLRIQNTKIAVELPFSFNLFQ